MGLIIAISIYLMNLTVASVVSPVRNDGRL